jgi:hypothetical protein
LKKLQKAYEMKSFSQFNELKRPTIVSAPIRGPNQDQSGESPSHSTADYTISDEKKKNENNLPVVSKAGPRDGLTRAGLAIASIKDKIKSSMRKEEIELDEAKGYKSQKELARRDASYKKFNSPSALAAKQKRIEAHMAAQRANDAAYKEKSVKEEIDINKSFDKTKPAHVAARKTVSGMSSLAHAEFHDDGSATVHTKSNKDVSSVRVVDHHHDVHGLGYNRSAKTYNKYSRKKDGLTHSTKKTGPDSHEIYIKEEIELEEAKRGRPPKNKTESDPGSDNIIMQLRKVITLRGQNPVTFVDGKKSAVSPSTAHRLLAYYDNLRTTGEKHTFSQRIHKSADSMRDVISGKKQIIKTKISLGGSSYKDK